jgi:hypothetical protein
MSSKRASSPGTYSFITRKAAPTPTEERELSEQESEEAFKIIVTLREAIEAADSMERRLEGTSDHRYATFLTKVRDRHLQIAETARHLLIDMIVTMSGEASMSKGAVLTLARRPG